MRITDNNASGGGRFYFKLTAIGNLIGEYSNLPSKGIHPESARRVSGDSKSYVGSYDDCWLDDKDSEYAKLDISQNEDKNNSIFILVWKDNNDKIIFKGRGMLCDNILIGNYWSA